MKTTIRVDYAKDDNERAHVIADAVGTAIGVAILACVAIAMLRWLS